MKVVRAVPTESISEKLSVQRLSEALGVHNLRANVFTIAEGSMSKHMHREQEEIYLVLDGTAMIDVDEEQFKVGEREALGVPAHAWHRVANVGTGPLTFFVAAAPADGFALLRELAAIDDRDVHRIVRSNLDKSRLSRPYPTQVAEIWARLKL